MTPEGRVVARLKKAFTAIGAEVRKCAWVGHVGAPDLFIMIRRMHFWVEVKAPGELPKPHQFREIARLQRLGGCAVIVIDNEDDAADLARAFAETKHSDPLAVLYAWGIGRE